MMACRWSFRPLVLFVSCACLVQLFRLPVSALDLRMRWDIFLTFVKRQWDSGETKLVWYWYKISISWSRYISNLPQFYPEAIQVIFSGYQNEKWKRETNYALQHLCFYLPFSWGCYSCSSSSKNSNWTLSFLSRLGLGIIKI